MLSLLLLASIVFVGARTYQFWQAGPWDLPAPGKAKETAPAAAPKEEPPQFQVTSTRNIVEKNLFDPERGTTRTNEVKAAAEAAAMQKIRSMVLLGTAILGSSRYAIMQEPSASRAPSKSQSGNTGQMRLKLGDTVEGFKLSEVREKSVVFTKGASKVELAIDFFRPGEEPPAPRAPVPPRPAIAPRVGTRGVPSGESAQTPTKQDNSSAVEGARKALRERQLQPPQQPAGRPPERAAPSNPESAPAQSP